MTCQRGEKHAAFLVTANLGCTKCYKVFAGGVGSKLYSGFNSDSWKIRTHSEHQSHVQEIHKKTVISSSEVESKYGCRYSILFDLPYYFDPTRMLVIIEHNYIWKNSISPRWAL